MLRFLFSEPERHGSTRGKRSVFKKPDRSARAASARGEAFRISGRTSKPKRGWGKR
ncbi:hypothetical protein OG730_41865 (plasmid) [Streptomyces sp. NBC_01298]|uniref:hypothetical protein n=1 Tax=Streptomyces sp. NBC_01298 TaxID=2903817 RepID=UPI002E15EF46|nr:hypothetical protein OG730_41865 [Streptomyces sp. NBC_01298]